MNIQPAHRTSRMSLTGVGGIFIILLLITGFLSVVLANNYLVVLFSTMLAFLVSSIVLTPFSLKAIEVKRTVPDHAFAGDEMEYGLTLRNDRKWFPELMVTLRDHYAQDGSIVSHIGPEHFLSQIRPGHTARLAMRIQPPRRGMLTFQSLTVSAEIPPGVVRATRTFPLEDRLLIYPRRAAWTGTLNSMITTSEETLQYQPSAYTHGYTEWSGLREFLPGDNPRHIFWKSYGRLNDRLLLKEFESSRERKAVILLDPYLSNLHDQKHLVRLDTAISFSMALADELIREQYTVTFVTQMTPEQAGIDRIMLNSERLNQFELYEALARIQPVSSSILPAVLTAQNIPLAGTVLFVLGLNQDPVSYAGIVENLAGMGTSMRNNSIVVLHPSEMRLMIRFTS